MRRAGVLLSALAIVLWAMPVALGAKGETGNSGSTTQPTMAQPETITTEAQPADPGTSNTGKGSGGSDNASTASAELDSVVADAIAAMDSIASSFDPTRYGTEAEVEAAAERARQSISNTAAAAITEIDALAAQHASLRNEIDAAKAQVRSAESSSLSAVTQAENSYTPPPPPTTTTTISTTATTKPAKTSPSSNSNGGSGGGSGNSNPQGAGTANPGTDATQNPTATTTTDSTLAPATKAVDELTNNPGRRSNERTVYLDINTDTLFGSISAQTPALGDSSQSIFVPGSDLNLTPAIAQLVNSPWTVVKRLLTTTAEDGRQMILPIFLLITSAGGLHFGERIRSSRRETVDLAPEM